MSLDVVLCTHNPRLPTLRRVINALVRQTSGPQSFRFLLVDNASSPPVRNDVLHPLTRAGVDARRVEEPALGLTRARLRALAETRAELLLFVDDDNELSERYLEEGLRFASKHPGVGAFGGKLLLPPELEPPYWVSPFLNYLGIKDAGDEVIVGSSLAWGPWEPPGAGLFVRRVVAQAYGRRVESDPRCLLLGRQGERGLASCDDSFLVRQAPSLGLSTAYVPQLWLHHHLEPERFRYRYLLRLLTAFGASLAVLEALVSETAEIPNRYRGRMRSLITAWHGYRIGRRRSQRFGFAMFGHHLAARRAWVQLSRDATFGQPSGTR
ncbi:MAG TPA: glycosyltransferase [Anaeromyxobacter sp.]|nr:glycosyltransferase [Anaeromyxobacter sp.]